jgi:undecaprenyl-phosphate galactose phosphotransferase
MFIYEGIYTRRYDFWQETRIVFKSLFFAFVLTMALLAMTKSNINYSRAVITLSFVFMALFIPTFKYFVKRFLFKAGIWRRKAHIYGDDPLLKQEIFENAYLGYVNAGNQKADTVFINSQHHEFDDFKRIIDRETLQNHEVIFIPVMNDYDLTRSYIYQLSNTRNNLIVLQNRLKSTCRTLIKEAFNYTLAIALLPVLLPVIGILAYLIKTESPGPIFFVHKRIGKNGKVIPILKFRSMYADAQERLEKLLNENEEIRKEWETNFKLKNDPRITKIGAFLRKTSLDELPQIFNVLKGEMSFVGPRPVVKEELEKYYKDNAKYYFMVKPGITGLWQVSGRSDTDYDFRIKTDVWYVRNWSLWLDIVILVKTVKTVLKREGAY